MAKTTKDAATLYIINTSTDIFFKENKVKLFRNIIVHSNNYKKNFSCVWQQRIKLMMDNESMFGQ